TVLYSSLVSGGCLHLFSRDTVNNAVELLHYFTKHRIDCLKIVPTHWLALSPGERSLLPEKILIFGGETLYAEVIDKIRKAKPPCLIVNHYGPTETTVGKMLHIADLSKKYDSAVPIGRSFGNTRAYVLTRSLQLAPLGIPGELYIGGDGVSSGYWANDALTKRLFIQDPFLKDGSFIYKTGDLVKILPDRNILFMGRTDNQVKIRGYRIEIGEIEKVLQEAPGVAKGAAV